MMKYARYAGTLCCAVMLLIFGACSSTPPSSPDLNQSYFSGETSDEDLRINDSFVDSIRGITPVNIDIDNIDQSIAAEPISGFDYSDYVRDDTSFIRLITIVDDVVYFEKYIQKTENTSDIYYYQYNLSTGESKEFDGYIADFSSSSNSYAFVGSSIYFTIETLDAQVHYKVDLISRKVSCLKSLPLSRDTDSFVYTFALDDEKYVESFFNINGDTLTYHVIVFSQTGEKEIITKSSKRDDEIYVYSASAGTLYEYSQKNHLSECYLSTYDENGVLLSSDFLKEVTSEIANDPSNYLDHFVVMNRYKTFNIGCEMPRETCILYDTADNEVKMVDDVRFCAPSQNHDSNCLLPIIAHSKTGEPERMNLCFIDRAGYFHQLEKGLDYSFSVANGDDTIVYIKNTTMYKITL